MNTRIIKSPQGKTGASAGILALLLVAANSLHADDFNWNVASGTWDTSTNWSPNGTPGAGDNVTLNFGSANSLTLNGTNQNVATFTKLQGVRIDILGNGATASSLTAGTISNSTNNFIFSNGALDVGGLSVNATNVTIGGGALFFGATTATGYGNLLNGLAVTGTTSISAGQLLMNVDGDYSLGLLSMAGGTVSLQNTNGLRASPVTTASVTGLSGAGGTIQGAVNVGSVIDNVITLAITNTSDYTSASVIRDSASGTAGADGIVNLSKAGVGTQTLTGASTYTGTTTVHAGTLLVNGSHSGGGGYSIEALGTLGGIGQITATSVTFADGAKLDVGGAGVGTLTLALSSGGLDLSAVNTVDSLLFELGAVGSSDKVILTVGTLNVGTLNFNEFAFTTTDGFGEGSYVLFDAATSVGGTIAQASGMIGGMQGTLTIDSLNHDVVLTITSIPEPSSAALLLAFTGLCQASVLRRRKVRA